MDKFVFIRGGNPRDGAISGAKTRRCPAWRGDSTEDVSARGTFPVRDIERRRLLTSMGAEVELGYGRAQLEYNLCRDTSDPKPIRKCENHARRSLVLGPLGRTGMVA